MGGKPTRGWPAGRPRNTVDEERLAAVLESLAQALALAEQWRSVSVRGLAEHLGVSDTSVQRWLSGQNRPNAKTLRQIERWLARMSPG